MSPFLAEKYMAVGVSGTTDKQTSLTNAEHAAFLEKQGNSWKAASNVGRARRPRDDAAPEIIL